MSESVPVEVDGPVPECVAEFTVTRPGRIGGPRLNRENSLKLPSADEGAQWLRRLGWPVSRDIDPARFLPGAALADAGLMWPYTIGERFFCHSMSRWALNLLAPNGLADEHWRTQAHGLWDLDNPGPPVMTWPHSPPGPSPNWNPGPLAPEREWRRRVVKPIIDESTLDGVRLWTQLEPATYEGADSYLQAFFHFSPDHCTSVTLAMTHRPPCAKGVSHVGYAHVAGMYIPRLDPTITGYDGAGVFVELDSVETALRVVDATYPPWGWNWQPIPDDVPRGLQATNDWVLTQAGVEVPDYY